MEDKELQIRLLSKLSNLEDCIDAVAETNARHQLSTHIVEMRKVINPAAMVKRREKVDMVRAAHHAYEGHDLYAEWEQEEA
jgi:hypothetical protein